MRKGKKDLPRESSEAKNNLSRWVPYNFIVITWKLIIKAGKKKQEKKPIAGKP